MGISPIGDGVGRHVIQGLLNRFADHHRQDGRVDQGFDDLLFLGGEILQLVVGFELFEDQFDDPSCRVSLCDLFCGELRGQDIRDVEVISLCLVVVRYRVDGYPATTPQYSRDRL